MTKNGSSLSIVRSCTIRKPLERRFLKVKKTKFNCPTHFLLHPKIAHRPESKQKWVFISMVMSYTIVKSMERRFEKDQKY